MNPYDGPLDYSRMSKWALRAYQSWAQQQRRSRARWGVGVGYSSRQFIGWWLHEMRQKPRWDCPTVSRIDHDKGYYFGNIRLEERADNIRERNARRGNPGNTHRAVNAFCAKTNKYLGLYPSKLAAAKFYGLSEKTVYNHCEGRTRQFFKFGPKTRLREVRFEWA